MKTKETFVMYKSYIDAVNKVKNNDAKLELLLAICNYSLTGVEPEFNSDVADIVFTAIKPSIDGASKRYEASVENGKKGGAPKGTTPWNKGKKKSEPKANLSEPNNEPTQTKSEPNANLYVYDDVYVYEDEYVDDNVYVSDDVSDDVDVSVYDAIDVIQNFCKENEVELNCSIDNIIDDYFISLSTDDKIKYLWKYIK